LTSAIRAAIPYRSLAGNRRMDARESAAGSPVAAEGATAPESLRSQDRADHIDALESRRGRHGRASPKG